MNDERISEWLKQCWLEVDIAEAGGDDSQMYARGMISILEEIEAVFEDRWCHCGWPADFGFGWCTKCKFAVRDNCPCSNAP